MTPEKNSKDLSKVIWEDAAQVHLDLIAVT